MPDRQAARLAVWEDEGGATASVEQPERVTPGVMAPGSSEHPGRGQALEAGIERYLGKPVTAAAPDEVFA